MSMSEIASAVFIGNLMTASLVYAVVQFHRHDYRAPWMAYVAFLLPIIVAVIDFWLSGARPPILGALAAPR